MTTLRANRLTQEMADTYQRALTGGPFYAAAWLLVAIYGDAFVHAPLATWSLLATFVGLATWRFLHRPLAGGAEAPALRRWLRVHWGIVFATTATWGALFVWATIDPAFGAARITALLFTLGLATAIAHAFSMRRGFALSSIALLVLPGVVTLWVLPADRANGLMFVIYLAYVVISLLRSHAEYQQRLDLDQALRNQRDLFSLQSRIDPLTELANRRQFADVLDAATRAAARDATPLALVLLDLDHFKQVNDVHGHAVGDACLVAVGERLRVAFDHASDLPARIGGEEFAVVLDGNDGATALQRAERFRMALALDPVVLGDVTLAMTASLGIVQFDPAAHPDVDALYLDADRAVYRAKATGRNRTCMAAAAATGRGDAGSQAPSSPGLEDDVTACKISDPARAEPVRVDPARADPVRVAASVRPASH